MFKKTTPEPHPFQTQIDELLEALNSRDVESPEYALVLDRLQQLYAIHTPEKVKPGISADAALAVGGNLLGILLILNFERAGVLASKAMSFVMKSKL